MVQGTMLETFDNGYQYAMSDTERSKNVHHTEDRCMGQGSHKHCRNVGVHPHWEVQLLHVSKRVRWVVMTPNWPA
jgi:hypothetical protein